MENPDTWTPDTWAIQKIIGDHQRQVAQGVIGGSLAKEIEDAVVAPLRKELGQLMELFKAAESLVAAQVSSNPRPHLEAIKGLTEAVLAIRAWKED